MRRRIALALALALTVTLPILMAGCATTRMPAAGSQIAQVRHLQQTVKAAMPYLLFLPRDYNAMPARRWPVLFFLHGSGERGNDLSSVKRNGPPGFLDTRPDFPFIVVSPQAPENGTWDPHVLHALLRQLQSELRIDNDRVSVTGLSMGGIGTWNWAFDYPEDLAAIAPVSGQGDEDRVCLLRHLPVWDFHGEDDTVLPIELERRAIDTLKACGGQPRWTTYPGIGHDAWTKAYADPALYDWLLVQKRRPSLAIYSE